MKPKTVALSRLRCRRSGSRAGELVVLGGARGQMEPARVNQEQRGGRSWPESWLQLVGDSGVAVSNSCSLGALWAWGLGENGEGAEGV